MKFSIKKIFWIGIALLLSYYAIVGGVYKVEYIPDAPQIKIVHRVPIILTFGDKFGKLDSLYDDSRWLIKNIYTNNAIGTVELSPDKKTIAFTEENWIGTKTSLIVYDLINKTKKTLFEGKTRSYYLYFQWLLDNTIVYPTEKLRDTDIYTSSPPESGFKIIDRSGKIITDKATAIFWRLLPQSRDILYTNDYRTYNLYHLNKSEEQLFSKKHKFSYVSISPKGDFMLFHSIYSDSPTLSDDSKSQKQRLFIFKFSEKILHPILTFYPNKGLSVDFEQSGLWTPNAFWRSDGKIDLYYEEGSIEDYDTSLFVLKKVEYTGSGIKLL